MIEPSTAVVVITGASSGIGRATAEAFARQGARLVLCARREDALEEAAEACRRAGATGVVVRPADVTSATAMEELASTALLRFGQIDVWINNAGVGIYGPFANGRMELQRQVIETNLIGAMNGTAAVLPEFMRQRRGVLIGTVSMGGWAPIPQAAAYTASKFGLRGFLAALRQEIALDYPDIHVCGVFPGMIDTPGFVHGANVSGHELQPGRIIHPPEDVAAVMVDLVRRPRPETGIGIESRVGQFGYGLAPSITEALGGMFLGAYTRSAPPAPRTDGAVLRPVPEGRTARGGMIEALRQRRARMLPAMLGVAGIAAMGLLAYASWGGQPAAGRHALSGPSAARRGR